MQKESIKKAIVNIKVIGVGGGGNSVLKRIASEGSLGLELIAVNTDKNQLQTLAGEEIKRLQIGGSITGGLGSGGKINVGAAAAQDDKNLIKNAIFGADMVFITAGMGGGTGTGAMPVIAEIAHSMGILTIGVVTMPFSFEGSRKKKTAEAGVDAMRPYLDALIIIYNDKLLELQSTDKRMSLINAFNMADGILKQAIRCISELILTVGIINVDLADVKSIFRQNHNSEALLGIGESTEAVRAVKMALESPLIERSVHGARGIVLNITGDDSLSLYEVNEATKFIYENTSLDVNIILGTVINPELVGKVRATIIATDFSDDKVVMPDKPTDEDQGQLNKANTKEVPPVPGFMQNKGRLPSAEEKYGNRVFDVERINRRTDALNDDKNK